MLDRVDVNALAAVVTLRALLPLLATVVAAVVVVGTPAVSQVEEPRLGFAVNTASWGKGGRGAARE